MASTFNFESEGWGASFMSAAREQADMQNPETSSRANPKS